jgi:5'-nucleotidase
VLQEGADPRGRVYFWLNEEPGDSPLEPETDYAAVFSGHASITPIELERTHEPSLRHLSTWADLLEASLKA